MEKDVDEVEKEEGRMDGKAEKIEGEKKEVKGV